MGLHRKGIIVEFYGLPGAGKTSTSNELINKIRKKGYKACKIEEVKIKNRFLKQVGIVINILRISNLKQNIILFCLLISIKPISISRIKYLKGLYNFMYLYNRKDLFKSNDIVIVDQGIIQMILSMTYPCKFKRDNIMKKLVEIINSKYEHILYVGCNIDAELAKERIVDRNLFQGRFDFIKDQNELIKALNKQNQDIKVIKETIINGEKSNNIQLNMSEEIQVNAELVNEYLEKVL